MGNAENINKGCCSCGSGCCDNVEAVQSNKKSVVIDFLYLDLSTCTWCQGTEQSLEDALNEVSNVLKASEIEVVLNKINVISEELAMKHKFISSPTIRVNGKDIQMDIKEKKCESCGDLCGDSVDCRVWEFNGEEYTIPPKALIIEGILKSVFGGESKSNENNEYKLPENLKRFYTAMKEKSNNESCCGGEKTDKCCG
jgi:glutaredoxin